MDFKNSTEGDCGRVNALAQLSRHIVKDVAHQGSIGHPIGFSGLAQNSSMPPQSFRMHDLMNEIDTMEPQRSLIPANQTTSSLASQWTSEYQQTEGYSRILPVPSLKNVKMMCSRKQPSYNMGLSFYPPHNFAPQHQEYSENFDLSSGISVNSLDELDDSYQCEEQNKPPVENKVQQDTDSKPVPQKYWRGIPIYDESLLSIMLATMTETHTFILCLRNYAEKCCDDQSMSNNPIPELETDHIRGELIPKAEDYPHIKDNPAKDCDNPIINAERAFYMGNFEEAILYADEAARQNPDDIRRWCFLQIIFQNESRYLESFYVAKQILRLDNTHTMAHTIITIVYLQDDGCFYEAFRTMVHWLQNHKSYGDIPLNFSMVENVSRLDGTKKTWIDSNQHIIDGVKNMLLTATRRNPTNADLSVQSFLSLIFRFIMEYDKSADCLRTIAHSKERHARNPNACYNAGFNLFLCGKPYEALDDILIGIENSQDKVKGIAYELLGIIYMYLTDYRKAIRYFKEALDIDPLDEEFALPTCGDILKAENELCLLLYSKLYDILN